MAPVHTDEGDGGKSRGGAPLSRRQIHYLLTNPIYIGKVRHKDRTFPGQHDAIIDQALWDNVQDMLIARSARARGTPNGPSSSAALTGRVFDADGSPLLVTQARGKGGRRYRYYVSRDLVKTGSSGNGEGWRLPAARLETTVAAMLAAHLDARVHEYRLLQNDDLDSARATAGRAQEIVSALRAEDHSVLGIAIRRVVLDRAHISLALDRGGLSGLLVCDPNHIHERALTCAESMVLRRRGVEARIMVGDRGSEPDPVLVGMLAAAHEWVAKLRAGQSMSAIAADSGHSTSYLRTRMKLAFFAPKIQKAILAGEQPADLTLERIVRTTMPLDWDAQARKFGFRF